jgi:hypothetical protein
MSRAGRALLVVIGVATSALLGVEEAVAAGGPFPSDPRQFGFELKDSGKVTAVLVLDPNGPVSSGAPSTPSGPFGTMAITIKKVGTAAATFRVEPESSLGELQFGCNPFLTNQRFVELAPGVPGLPFGGPTATFANWLPSDVTAQLFSQLGVAIFNSTTQTTLMVPAITGVIKERCVPFPKKNQTLDYLMLNEVLEKEHVKPVPPTYPDRTISTVPPPPDTQQWFPGFLVLEVTIGFWALPTTPTP